MANTDREFSWDDEVKEESTFTLLEEGDYRFRMTSLVRGRHTGSSKLPACGKAIVTLEILDGQGAVLTELKHNLFLHSVVEGLLSAFFLATGAKRHGEALNIAQGFRDSVGRVGWCHIYVDTWTGDDGRERKSNKIKYFIDPEKAPSSSGSAAAAAPAGGAKPAPAFTGWGAN